MDTTRKNYTGEEARLAGDSLNLPRKKDSVYGIISGDDSHCSTLVLVQNRYGIHARPSARVIKLVNQYPHCEILAETDTQKINAKEIMDWLTFDASLGTRVKFTAIGKNCIEALEKMVVLFDSKFDEE